MYLTDLTIKIPVVCEIYYLTAGTINHHHAICTNQCRIYHAIVTINLLKCLKLTMFAMMITDVWLLYKYACGNSNTLMSAQFVEFLAIEMIVIGCKYRVTMRAGAIVLKMNGIDINVQQRPTKCFRKGSNTHWTQGRCVVCRECSIIVCSCCSHDNEQAEIFICCQQSGCNC